MYTTKLNNLAIIAGLFFSPLILIGALVALVLIGIAIIVVLGTLILLLPALIISGIVWWLTGSELLAGLAFLLIALLAFIKK